MHETHGLSQFLHAINHRRRLSLADEQDQVAQARSGDARATESLIQSHVAFVVHVAKEFRHSGVPLEDLIAEGCVGLLKAIRGYRAQSGTRFMTYASFWVRKEILAAVSEQPHAVHVPRYAREQGCQPIRPLRLDAPLKHGDDGSFADRLRHPGPLPVAAVIDGEQRRRLGSQVMQLAARERAVLAWRFGLGGYAPQTLHEIADRLGVSKERVRQIEVTALARLRETLGTRARRSAPYQNAVRARSPLTATSAV